MAAGTRVLEASEKRSKAMADPNRIRILQHILEEGVKAASEVANELGLPLNSVSYHCGKLLAYECIELVRVEIVRGGAKKYYRAIEQDYISAPNWEDMEDWRKPGALTGIMALIIGDFDHALEADTFGDDGRWHLMRNPLRSVDQRALDDLLEAHMDLYERSIEIQREAAERLANCDEQPISVASSSECFRVAAFRGRKRL